MVECLPREPKALGSIPSMAKTTTTTKTFNFNITSPLSLEYKTMKKIVLYNSDVYKI